MRKWVVVVSFLMCALLMGNLAVFAKEVKDITVAFVAMNVSMSWMRYAAEAIKKEAERLGINLIVFDSENDIAKQAANIEDAVAKGVDAIITDPIDVKSLNPAIEEAVNKGVPVVTFDRAAVGAPYLFFVGSDDVLAGRLAAKFIATKLGGKGKVVVLEGTPGSSPALDRGKGFKEEIAKYPEIEIAFWQSGEFYREKGMAVMEDAIAATGGKFDAVYSQNDDMMIGAIEAMKDAGIDPKNVVTVATDGIPDALLLVKEGVLDATIQYPVEQAPLALRYLVEYLQTGQMPPAKDTRVAPWLITACNLEMADLYPEIAGK